MSIQMSTHVKWEQAVRWLMNQPDQRDLVLACYYDEPRLAAAERFRASEEWQATRFLLPSPRGRALDMGAGHGISSYALAMDGWRTTALEPDPSPLVGAEAIRRLAMDARLAIDVVETVAEEVPFDDAQFDLVYGRQVLHHARDLNRFCRQMYRVLRPGGALVATREHVVSSSRQLDAFRVGHPLHYLYGGESAFRLKEYLEALRGAGFIIERTIRPFESVVNYAPFTRDTLRAELQRRLAVFPGGAVVGRLLEASLTLSIALKLISVVDRRPGRLFSFRAIRPQT